MVYWNIIEVSGKTVPAKQPYPKGGEGETLIGLKEYLSKMCTFMASSQQLNCYNKLICITYNGEYADHSMIDFMKSLYQQCDILLLQEHGWY